jgi:hypothetical protein
MTTALHSSTQPQPARRTEPVYVFGTDSKGNHKGEHAAFAMRYHGAQAGTWNGPSGNSYMIPYRNGEGHLLPLKVIGNYVKDFLAYAASRPDSSFQVTRFASGGDAYGDDEVAALFRAAPKNVALPGIWARALDPTRAVRLYTLDPGCRLAFLEFRKAFAQYFSINVPLWGPHGVELCSTGTARSVTLIDKAARELGLRHRIFGQNAEVYGKEAGIAAELKAVCYCTHLLSVVDLDQTGQVDAIRVMSAATRNGLAIEQLPFENR